MSTIDIFCELPPLSRHHHQVFLKSSLNCRVGPNGRWLVCRTANNMYEVTMLFTVCRKTDPSAISSCDANNTGMVVKRNTGMTLCSSKISF